jgi:nitroimidazol reductase NimA-like FMN-containing flavoprotein (pyridoxamine 5'-phosphate oxidase superfamily)/ribosomal protein S18 acetylase RimI-like enzyme
MRKETFFRMERAAAVELLATAPTIFVSSTAPDDEPIFRAMNAAVVDGMVAFHAAAAGEKTLALGRPAVVSAIDEVATLPSHFLDPERACPATTLYRSVQVHGTLVPIDDGRKKARVLQALMDKHQPEGGFVPLDHAHPLYQKEIASLLLFGVSLERLDGKAKLGQNRKPEEREKILDGLWRRGAPGDLRAIQLILAANPKTPTPAFLAAPPGVTLCVHPNQHDARAVATLLHGTYWNDRFSKEEIALAHLESSAWVVAKGENGEVLASARAVSDGSKRAWIYDVIVGAEVRKQGLGDRVMRLLLDHPRLRRTKLVALGTRDAAGFYARLGFKTREQLPARSYTTIDMLLER